MKCIHPVLRRIKTKKLDGNSGLVWTPCGICTNCRKNFAHMWGTRVFHESLDYENCCFITLTYSIDKLPIGDRGNPTINIEDVQKFFKSWREYIYPEKIRYFVGCEYTPGNHLPHYHCAVFGASIWDKRIFTDHYPRPEGGYWVTCRFWDKGLVHAGNLEPGSAMYVAGYALKKVSGSSNKNYYKDLGIVPPRALMSRNPGIGCAFMQRYQDVMRRLGCCTVDGWKVNLPRYYQEKIDFKNTDFYKNRQEKDAQRMFNEWLKRSNMTVEEFQQSIKEYLDLCKQYDWNENYHNFIADCNERVMK